MADRISSRVSPNPGYFDPLVAPFHWDGDSGDAVVMVHGFTGTAAHFRLLGRFLHDRSHTVIAPLLAGHGTSREDMATTGAADWLDSVRAAFSTVANHDRVHLVGLSMGGLLSLILAEELGAESVSTINSPIRFRNLQTYAAPWLVRSRPMIDWPEAPPPPLTPEAQPLWLAYSGFPTKGLVDLLELSRRALRAATELDMPSLTIQSRADDTVHPSSAERLSNALAPRNRLVWLDRSIHNALLDGERDIIHHAVLARITDI